MKQLVCLLLFLGTAVAEDHSSVKTHDMYNHCKLAVHMADGDMNMSVENIRDGSFCLGYLRGVADSIQDISNTLIIDSRASTEALARSFVNFVNAHPGDMDNQSVLAVLSKAWTADNILTGSDVKRAKQQ